MKTITVKDTSVIIAGKKYKTYGKYSTKFTVTREEFTEIKNYCGGTQFEEIINEMVIIELVEDFLEDNFTLSVKSESKLLYKSDVLRDNHPEWAIRRLHFILGGFLLLGLAIRLITL